MKILLTGASGFIGGRLRRALRAEGHTLRLAGRRPPPTLEGAEEWVEVDLAHPGDPADWLPALDGIDVVVNAVGILRERGAQTFQALHVDGPAALFRAALRARVGRVVHISALGADSAAASAYHRSKRAGDEILLGLPLAAVVVQPSLVFGPGGASARLFLRLAALPVLPLPAGGRQAVQPIHVDDLVACLAALARGAVIDAPRLALVGPEPLSLRGYLQALRAALGLPEAPTVSIPAALMRLAARLGTHLPGAALDTETWAMLERGNVAPAEATRRLLGHPPRPAERFVAADCAAALRRSAQLDGLLPLLRIAVALVWIVTGIVSLGLYPAEASYALLARAGVTGALAPWALYGAALLDLGLGLATLMLRRRRRLWLAQMVLILGYTAIISARLPEFWLHPYGPVLKNLPLLAVLALLWTLDRDGEAT